MSDGQTSQTAFDRIGGAAVLRPVIDDFVARMVVDPMIGFHFAGVDTALLAQREYELSASLLGAPVTYSGRPIRDVHARHPIFGGQFMRRRQLLIEALQRGGVDQGAIDQLIAHVDRLRPLVTQEQGSSCLGSADVGPLLISVPGRADPAATPDDPGR